MPLVNRSPRPMLRALFSLASKEEWCWNLSCTTCGHMHFRYSFQEIIKGVHPDSGLWKVKKADNDWTARLGPMPFHGAVPIEIEEKLLATIFDLDLNIVARHYVFPDWLGYIGLFLHYTERAEQISGKATGFLVPQFMKLVGEESPAHVFLSEILKSSKKRLRVVDLESIESALSNSDKVKYRTPR